MMDSSELTKVVDRRLEVVEQLVALTDRQLEAIDGGRMNELMSILSAKQSPLTELGRLSRQLADEAGVQPDARDWSCEEDRLRCRESHERAERMLVRLVDQEREGQERLRESQSRIQQDLCRNQETGRALKGYASVSADFDSSPRTADASGDRLDLSSHS